MGDTITVRKLMYGDPELQKAFSIRKKVFVDEQHCTPELEYQHDDVSAHFIAYYNDFPCGAARWRSPEKGIKLERFAVLPVYRGKGVGAELVRAVLADIPSNGDHVYLNAQVSARDFYLPFGFIPVGEEFEEAGITHQQMLFSGRS